LREIEEEKKEKLVIKEKGARPGKKGRTKYILKVKKKKVIPYLKDNIT